MRPRELSRFYERQIVARSACFLQLTCYSDDCTQFHTENCARIYQVSYSRAVPLVFILLSATISPTQSRERKALPPSAFKLISVQVSGTRHYKAEDVISACGLKIGQTVHDQDLKDAVRRLGETDAFTAVAYTFDYSPEGTTLGLKVKDADLFAPVRFENLVWFSNQELFAKLHAQVPLFDGELPVKGPLADDLTQALQAMLDEKKIPAQVDCVRAGDQDAPAQAFVFSAAGPRIIISSVEFSGADATELPALENAAKNLRGTEYLRSKLLQQEPTNFLPILLQHGYLKADFGDPEAKVTQTNQDETLVDVSVPVNLGPQYKVKSVVLAGYKAIPLKTLREAIHLQPGQTADAVQLGNDIDSIKATYGSHGYMDVSVQSTPELDDARHTVVYRLAINEGDVFKMGDLEILGVDSRVKDRLQNNWTLLTGDTYNSGYTRRFVSQALKDVFTTGDWSPDIQETLDRRERTVDVTLHFVAKY